MFPLLKLPGLENNDFHKSNKEIKISFQGAGKVTPRRGRLLKFLEENLPIKKGYLLAFASTGHGFEIVGQIEI